ncbi:Ni/Fe-hydrogenase cytochrome b subunit [bacterium]|nr:Ni/Fe-hydrogenase cytochrome b subunit [bacterium]
MKIPRLTFWRAVFLVVVALGLYSTYVRFMHGLGASTHLSDRTPWGLWIGFDVLCGVGLAAGGFTMTAMVYLFNLKQYYHLTRAAILTAFLGYIMVTVALLFDLGRPLRLWHPLVMGNPHSIMFEVALCVTFYSTVLAIEFAPCVLEPFGWKRLCAIIDKIKVPLVLFGVLLSMLHQSSLGSLYLIVPGKLHPLWYTSPWLPVLFFLSAVMVGLAMVIVESFWSGRALGHKPDMKALAPLGRIMLVVLAIYALTLLQIRWSRETLGLIAAGTEESYLFLLEIACGILIPGILLAMPRVRLQPRGLFTAAVLVVLGFVLNRMNVSVTGMAAISGEKYFPAWTEISITLMLVAIGCLLFNLAARYLAVFPHHGPAAPRVPARADAAVPEYMAAERS